MFEQDDDNDNNKIYNGQPESNISSPSYFRYNILNLIDTFIEQIFHIRKTVLGVSISAIIMAPIAIALGNANPTSVRAIPSSDVFNALFIRVLLCRDNCYSHHIPGQT